VSCGDIKATLSSTGSLTLKSDAGSGNRIDSLLDVNVATLANASILVYDSTTDSYVQRRVLSYDANTDLLKLDGCGTVITIKRCGDTNGTFTTLANGELAYSFSSGKLYIGANNVTGGTPVVTYIGGKLLVDKVANLESIFVPGSADLYAANLEIDGYLRFASGAYPAGNNGVLWANTSGIINFATGKGGEVLQISCNTGQPIFESINGGTY